MENQNKPIFQTLTSIMVMKKFVEKPQIHIPSQAHLTLDHSTLSRQNGPSAQIAPIIFQNGPQLHSSLIPKWQFQNGPLLLTSCFCSLGRRTILFGQCRLVRRYFSKRPLICAVCLNSILKNALRAFKKKKQTKKKQSSRLLWKKELFFKSRSSNER